MNRTKKLSSWTAYLVLAVAIIAFALSYNALRQVAADHGNWGQASNLAYLWPFLIDFALVVFSVAVIRASLLGEKTLWPWTLVVIFSLATVYFNLVDAPFSAVAYAVAITPPIALVLSFEMLMGMVRSGVKRQEVTDTIADLDNIRDSLDTEIGQLAGQAESLGRQIEDNRQTVQDTARAIQARREELERLGQETKVYLPANLGPIDRQGIVSQMVDDGVTNEAIAGLLGVSASTIKNDKVAIRANGGTDNGHTQ